MKLPIRSTLLLSLLIVPGTSLADYKVTLKKGTAFFVGDYWVNEDRVSFYLDGGMVGLPRDLVRYIGISDEPVTGVRTVIKKITFGADSEYLTAELKTDMQDWEQTREPPKIAARTNANAVKRIEREITRDQDLREEALQIQLELEAAKSAYKTARRAGKEEVWKMASQQIMKLGEKRGRLLKEAQDTNGGTTPAWWSETM